MKPALTTPPGTLRRLPAAFLSVVVIGAVSTTARSQGTTAENGAVPKAPPVQATTAPKQDAGVAFFRNGVVPRLKIQIEEAELKSLRVQHRKYVRCTIVENDQSRYEQVGVHLKGGRGSFRKLDDKPSLTLNFDKFQVGQTFHDLDKIHLNNSVADPSYLTELVSSELFLASNIPTPRVTHARVWLNGRDLGFYVLKEGFNKRFLKRHFKDATGNLYEGPFCQDIDGAIRLQNGSGPKDRSDVKAVVDASGERDPVRRRQRLGELVDIDRFLTFMALELMTCHWDGYCCNRNNYRFYFEPQSGKLQFFPHGMDQMFASATFSVLDVPATMSMIPKAVMSNPVWRRRYRDRLSELATKFFVPPDRLPKRVDELHRRLRPVLAEMGASSGVEFDRHTRVLKERLAARVDGLRKELAAAESLSSD